MKNSTQRKLRTRLPECPEVLCNKSRLEEGHEELPHPKAYMKHAEQFRNAKLAQSLLRDAHLTNTYYHPGNHHPWGAVTSGIGEAEGLGDGVWVERQPQRQQRPSYNEDSQTTRIVRQRGPSESPSRSGSQECDR